ncbi:MAG: AEC family transporter [Clostridia bacterium]|nr:AEC family transporter [Clostridia bacterium]
MTQFFINFSTVFVQVLILFIFIACGFAGAKKKFITTEGSKVISDVILYFVTPCVIIDSLAIEFDKSKFIGLITCFGAFMLVQIFTACLVHLLFRGDDKKTLRVLRYATVFSNVGYMGLPLQKAVLGDEGVFYGSVCVAAFNVFVWTYGIVCMSGDRKKMSPKGLLFNPGIIATTVGLILFIFSIKLPMPVASAIEGMAALNTPLAMMVIGFNLAGSGIIAALKNKNVYFVTALRLIIIPLISLLTLYLCGIRGTLLISLIIACSAPSAAVTTVFSVKYGNNVELSVNLVALTTLLSIITMSAIVALAQLFQ